MNVGDFELKQYLDPLLRNADGELKKLVSEQFQSGAAIIIDCVGNRMWAALNSNNWKHREAAATAFLQYLGESPTHRYQQAGTEDLFRASVLIASHLC